MTAESAVRCGWINCRNRYKEYQFFFDKTYKILATTCMFGFARVILTCLGLHGLA